MADVIYIKVRENHKVVSKACHIVIGISEEGKRRLLGFDISDDKSDDSWSRFINYLKERGLNDVKMVISDAHTGLVKAIKENFLNVSWQRYQVHFLRNTLDKTPKKETKEFKEDIKALFHIQEI